MNLMAVKNAQVEENDFMDIKDSVFLEAEVD